MKNSSLSLLFMLFIWSVSDISAFSPHCLAGRTPVAFRRNSRITTFLKDSPNDTIGELVGTSPVATVTENAVETINVDNSFSSASSSTNSDTFVNDGPLAGFPAALELIGLTEGKSIAFGMFSKEVDNEMFVSEEEAIKRRANAAAELVNIDMEERYRRKQAGDFLTVVSAVYILWATLIADDGGFVGHLIRAASFFPVFFAYAYKQSAKLGVCNIAQAGMWDVDGKGMSKIEDPAVARALLDKVNQFNLVSFVQVATCVSIFALLPQSSAFPLVSFAAIFVALYFAQDKIPEPKKVK